MYSAEKIQIQNEVFAIWDIIDTFYKTFGFSDLKIRISKKHDPKHFEKYLGTAEIWQSAEEQLTALVEMRGVTNWIDGIGEAAMYGPKLTSLQRFDWKDTPTCNYPT